MFLRSCLSYVFFLSDLVFPWWLVRRSWRCALRPMERTLTQVATIHDNRVRLRAIETDVASTTVRRKRKGPSSTPTRVVSDPSRILGRAMVVVGGVLHTHVDGSVGVRGGDASLLSWIHPCMGCTFDGVVLTASRDILPTQSNPPLVVYHGRLRRTCLFLDHPLVLLDGVHTSWLSFPRLSS